MTVTPPSSKREIQGAEHVDRFLFRYNPLHDLESLWWVAVYFLVTRDVTRIGQEQPVERPVDDINAQREWAYKLFWVGDRRLPVIRSGYFFLNAVMPCLCPSLRPLARDLETARQYLVGAYANAEKDDDVKFDIASGIHHQFISCFTSILHRLKTKDIQITSD